jgi:hypothetical protein
VKESLGNKVEVELVKFCIPSFTNAVKDGFTEKELLAEIVYQEY